MFGWFKKKKQAASLLEQIATAVYGDSPPTAPPDLGLAIKLAHETLLDSRISIQEVRTLAVALDNGAIPYSTHSLALSVALNFFRRSDRISVLRGAQLMARMTALQWAEEKKIPVMLLSAFEESRYTRYRPGE